MVGSYPGGMDTDIKWGDPAEHDEAVASIARVTVPETCPVYGEAGPLVRHWQNGG